MYIHVCNRQIIRKSRSPDSNSYVTFVFILIQVYILKQHKEKHLRISRGKGKHVFVHLVKNVLVKGLWWSTCWTVKQPLEPLQTHFSKFETGKVESQEFQKTGTWRLFLNFSLRSSFFIFNFCSSVLWFLWPNTCIIHDITLSCTCLVPICKWQQANT